MLALLLFVRSLLGIVLYFLPTLIAVNRRHYETARIFALNLLLGWTVFGWVIALIAACKDPHPEYEEIVLLRRRIRR